MKECVALDELEEAKKVDLGNRYSRQVDCLKVSVVPKDGWGMTNNNYCYHDKSQYEIWAQAANVVVWSAVEWGATAAAASVTFGAGAAAKPVMGFVAGAGSELTAQWIDNKYTQIWPGHP